MQNRQFPVYTPSFWQAYVVQMRPYLLFVSGVAGLAGIAAAVTDTTETTRMVLAFLPLFLGYGFGQAFTDCFQVDTDRLSAPYRPLSQGIVSVKNVMAVSLIGLVSGVGLLVYLNRWNLLTGVLSIAGLATYTYFKRNFWFAGPPYNAWIVSLLPLTGYLAVKGAGFWMHLPAIAPLMVLGFVSYANFVLMGYLKDISADRQSGYRTFSVVFGWMPTVWAGDVLALASAGLAAWLVNGHWESWMVWALATGIACWGQGYAHLTTNRTEANAAGPIAATVRSFILWHLAVILAFQPAWWPFLLVFYGLFEWALWARPSSAQV